VRYYGRLHCSRLNTAAATVKHLHVYEVARIGPPELVVTIDATMGGGVEGSLAPPQVLIGTPCFFRSNYHYYSEIPPIVCF